ncbi:hypothetical protein [Mesorhizobium sp. B2-7-1]|nr:hypothetical protein [Mesorhizobium sp. B2-7-1]
MQSFERALIELQDAPLVEAEYSVIVPLGLKIGLQIVRPMYRDIARNQHI